MKKTLITTISTEATSMTDGVIEAFKNLYRESLGGLGAISFEVVEIDETAELQRLYRRVEQEFAMSADEVQSSEKGDDQQ